MADSSLMDGDIVRLVYHADSISDIIHPFSVKGYEMLTSEFMSWAETLRPIMPRKKPVLLEIVGCSLSDEAKQIIDNAIWNHYRLRLAQAKKSLNASRKKLFIFVPCLLLSAILLFWAQKVNNELLTQYLYLPFWFFSYRILTYPIFDHVPLRREMAVCMQMASLKISTPEKPRLPLTEKERADIIREYDTFRRESSGPMLRSRLREQLLMENGILSFGCTVDHVDELINPYCGNGTALLSDTLMDYVSQAESLIDPKDTLQMEVYGAEASAQERQRINDAFRNSYTLKAINTENEIRDNALTITRFALCLLLSSLLLNSWGKRVDVAVHELLMVLFWFFGDYLVELILMQHLDLKRRKKKWIHMAAMKIVFSERID